jgi:5-formyltetrahydrofolate cyclo-ligase
VSDLPDLHSLMEQGDVALAAAPGPDKRTARAAVLSTRRALAADARAAADAAIRARLVEAITDAFALLPDRQHPRSLKITVCGYLPMAGEPGGPQLPDAIAGLPGVRLLLPVLRPDRDLDWAGYPGPAAARPGVALVDGAYGLREPAGPRLGVTAVTGADLVIAPAVAVAADGTRLGRGGGSYDRALARIPAGVPVLVPLYDGELVTTLPAQPHDQPVHAVVTPSGLRVVPGTGRNRPR